MTSFPSSPLSLSQVFSFFDEETNHPLPPPSPSSHALINLFTGTHIVQPSSEEASGSPLEVEASSHCVRRDRSKTRTARVQRTANQVIEGQRAHNAAAAKQYRAKKKELAAENATLKIANASLTKEIEILKEKVKLLEEFCKICQTRDALMQQKVAQLLSKQV